jgi:hypothetical protein
VSYSRLEATTALLTTVTICRGEAEGDRAQVPARAQREASRASRQGGEPSQPRISPERPAGFRAGFAQRQRSPVDYCSLYSLSRRYDLIPPFLSLLYDPSRLPQPFSMPVY